MPSGSQGLNSLLKKCFLGAAFPQRLEAAIDSSAVTARVELVPFPFVQESRVFQQTVSRALPKPVYEPVLGVCTTGSLKSNQEPNLPADFAIAKLVISSRKHAVYNRNRFAIVVETNTP